MAVSGRKVSDFHASVSNDFDQSCEPCLVIGKQIEAHGFCVNCNEYLCMNCFDYHQRIKATKHHQVLDKDNMDKQTTQNTDLRACIDKCLIHTKKTVKFFCTSHEFLGCTDCITLNHRTCTIDYIPDKCVGIGDSDEYRATLRQLEWKIKDIDAMIKKATLQHNRIDSAYDSIIQETVVFRKEINDRLDQLQRQIQTHADKLKLESKEPVKKVLESCTAASLEMKTFKSCLQNSKTLQQDGQLFITLKQAKSKLKSSDLKDTKRSLETAIFQHSFERNTDLENFLTRPDIFGKLCQSTTLVKEGNLDQATNLVTPRKKILHDKLTDIGDIRVRTKSDLNECEITGCAVLSNNNLVLADYNNNKLKVVDTQSRVVLEEIALDSEPYDIAVLPQEQIAVTIPDKQEIIIMTTTGKLSISRKIPVKGPCKSITYHQGQIYVICANPRTVIIADTQGNVNNKISLYKEIAAYPNYILLSEDARHIYISDYKSNSVVSVTVQGDISAVYKPKDWSNPQGLVMLEDGTLLVCSWKNGTIHHVSKDLKQGQAILEGLRFPRSICYNHHRQEVYIGGICDLLEIMKIEWKE